MLSNKGKLWRVASCQQASSPGFDESDFIGLPAWNAEPAMSRAKNLVSSGRLCDGKFERPFRHMRPTWPRLKVDVDCFRIIAGSGPSEATTTIPRRDIGNLRRPDRSGLYRSWRGREETITGSRILTSGENPAPATGVGCSHGPRLSCVAFREPRQQSLATL
jgi:hypothetical protein